MREILFKGKTEDGEWVEGSLFVYNKDNCLIITKEDADWSYVSSGVYDGSITEVQKDTICQYIGLTEKNGNKIWENDIISYPKIYAKGKVVFMEDTFVLFDEYEGKQYINGIWNEFEVIGNIFDNPELLKGE